MRGRRMRGPWMWGAPWMMCGGLKHGHYMTIEDELEGLEELQRDLEEAAADVAERIRRLRELESADA